MMEQTSPAGGPSIEAIGATVVGARSQRVLVSGIDWRVAAGEYWIVGGAHGCGKSSFLATVAGLRPPGAGVIRHFGQDLSGLSEQEMLARRGRVGFVFKGGGRMFAELTVAENVALPLRYHRDCTAAQAGEAVRALLETIELTPMADAAAQTLGMGWQQRVGLARALALQPEVLFLDEPLAGLEARHRHWWRQFLAQLSRGAPCTGGRKVTLVAATNDFSPWSGERHHFALLKDGKWHTLGQRDDTPEMN